MMNIFVILLLLFNLSNFFIESNCDKAIPCNENGLKQLDQIATVLFVFGDQTRKFPLNDQENSVFCR